MTTSQRTKSSKDWQVRGAAVLRFLGMKIYDITLATQSDWTADEYDKHPLRLQLTYAMKLEGKLLAEASLIEILRLSEITIEQSNAWIDMLHAAFPDVKKGDVLSGESDGKGGLQFWHNDKPTKATKDAIFAKLFLGVWLDRKTSVPEVRTQLLGL